MAITRTVTVRTVLILWVAHVLGVCLSSRALASQSAPTPEQHVRRLISLVDYVAGDYTEAVRQGQVVSASEYAEMQDFVRGASSAFEAIAKDIPPDASLTIGKQLESLGTLVEAKSDVTAIQAVIRDLKARVLALGLLSTRPEQPPRFASAETIYAAQCASCHGPTGHGNGPAALGMEPPPRNFHDSGVMEQGSPFKFFNALQLGIRGTSMAAYADSLSEEDRWSLAFYVATLRYQGEKTDRASPAGLEDSLRSRLLAAGLSLDLLSRTSDQELKAWVGSAGGVPEAQATGLVATLRTTVAFDPTLPLNAPQAALAQGPGAGMDQKALPSTGQTTSPATDGQTKTTKSLRQAVDFVAEAKARFAQGDLKGAENRLFDAYLEGFDPAEQALSLKDKELVLRVEQTFIAARAAARSGDADRFKTLIGTLEDDLRTSVTLANAPGQAGTSQADGGMGDFVASLIIILREGFEAFLVVAALLTLIRKTGNKAAKKWVHLGWSSAIAAGIGTFALFNWAFQVSGATRETIEAVSTGIAAVGLFYVSFWLLNQAERSRWDRFIKTSAKAVATPEGRIGAMFFVAFIAVYREAAETVLFYQALVNSASDPSLVASGFVVGCLMLLAISVAMIRFGIRLPMRQFFLATSTLMICISIVLVGKAVNELVNAGYIEPTRINRLPVVDILGIYPLWESVGLQIVALLLACVLAYVSAQRGKRAVS